VEFQQQQPVRLLASMTVAEKAASKPIRLLRGYDRDIHTEQTRSAGYVCAVLIECSDILTASFCRNKT